MNETVSESCPEAYCCCSGGIEPGLLRAGRLVRFSSLLQLHSNDFVVSWNRPPVFFSAIYFLGGGRGALRPNVGYGLLKFIRFLDHTQRSATVGRTPPDE